MPARTARFCAGNVTSRACCWRPISVVTISPPNAASHPARSNGFMPPIHAMRMPYDSSPQTLYDNLSTTTGHMTAGVKGRGRNGLSFGGVIDSGMYCAGLNCKQNPCHMQDSCLCPILTPGRPHCVTEQHSARIVLRLNKPLHFYNSCQRRLVFRINKLTV